MRRHPFVHFAALWLGSLAIAADSPETVAVSVVRSAEWSPGESSRTGAGEFMVLLEGAKLRRASPRAGLIVVGDQNGLLRSGGEHALRRLALSGVVVVRIASSGSVVETPDTLFLDAGKMGEATVTAVLRRALEQHGQLPPAVDPDHPRAVELAAVQAHLKTLQHLFEAGPTLAMADNAVR